MHVDRAISARTLANSGKSFEVALDDEPKIKLACREALLTGWLFLTCDCALARTTSSAIGTCALTANGQAHAVTATTVATNVHQSLDVHVHLTAKVTFNEVVAFNGFSQFDDVCISKILYTNVWINARFLDDLLRAAEAYTSQMRASNIIKIYFSDLLCERSFYEPNLKESYETNS